MKGHTVVMAVCLALLINGCVDDSSPTKLEIAFATAGSNRIQLEKVILFIGKIV